MAEPYFSTEGIDIYHGDARAIPLADGTVQTCVTSPPYWGLRDYGVEGQIGNEPTPESYVANIVSVAREVRRVLKDDGTFWLNLGDSYQNQKGQSGGIDPKQPARRHGIRPTDIAVPGLKPKDLVGIPWRVALMLQSDGWYLRSEIIWNKPNAMPDSTTDRPTRSHEHIFLLSKSRWYFYDSDAVAEDAVSDHASGNGFKRDARLSYQNGDGSPRGNDESWDGVGGKRNRRSVWTISTQVYPGAHFATFPPALIEPCILAGSKPGDLVLDPFNGSGTTGEVCQKWGRRYAGIELNADYIELSKERFRQHVLFGSEALPA